MANINFRNKVIECKIVYYGPGRSGKTTNLEYIFRKYRKNTLGEMVSINTKGDRTLFFDFLPLGVGKIKGLDVKVQLYTVPGQPKYSSTRKMVLKGVDGIVFVADSLKVRHKDNLWSLKDLRDNLAAQDKKIMKMPLVLQYNKQDLTEQGLPIIPVKEMERCLNKQLKVPSFSASALTGKEVGATLIQCIKLTVRNLNRELKAGIK
jgi:signal recognition particle receptor subunit beta